MCTPWEESYDQSRQHIQKQRHYFANKGPSSQGYVFSVVMYGCESWTVKKAEHQIMDAFELWCWRRLLRVPWTSRLKQSILKEISPEYSLERLVLKLKLQYFGHLMGRADSFEKTLMLGKIEGRRRSGWQRSRWLDDSMEISLTKLWEMVKGREAWGATVHGVAKSQTHLRDWTINKFYVILMENTAGGARGKEPICHCRRHKRQGFNLWIGKILWRRAWQHTPASCLKNPIPGSLQLIVARDWSNWAHGKHRENLILITQKNLVRSQSMLIPKGKTKR